MSYLSAGTNISVLVAPGLSYHQLRSPVGPWIVHLLQVDLNKCELGLAVLGGDGLARASELSRGAGAAVLAGVNGDFFTPEGRPLGTEIIQGVVQRRSARSGLAWRPGDGPWIGVAKLEGDSLLQLGWPLPLNGGDDATQMVGGFPELVRKGVRVGEPANGNPSAFAGERHPRTAVGHDARGNLWLVVVDGRQPGRSAGMTLSELSHLMESLGSTDALNLDGGGSSVMVLNGRPVSRPSGPQGERPVANALVVKRDEDFCPSPPGE
ncbi:MAG: phosphodiester glycosidase family protein [Gemmatimonadota bacterium]